MSYPTLRHSMDTGNFNGHSCLRMLVKILTAMLLNALKLGQNCFVPQSYKFEP